MPGITSPISRVKKGRNTVTILTYERLNDRWMTGIVTACEGIEMKNEDIKKIAKTESEPQEKETEQNQVPVKMDRPEAFRILGLPETANAYAVDNRFWQLTKRYRAEKDDVKLKEITDAYDVASGRAAAKDAEVKEYRRAPKVLGKTSAQWKVYFYYTWWKYLLLVVLVAGVLSIGYQILFTKDHDFSLVSIGHFVVDTTYTENYAKTLGYESPYITAADVIVDNSEGQSNSTIYGTTAAATYLSLNPDVIIMDSKTMPYYTGYLRNLDDYYMTLKEVLPAALFEKIEPIKYSMKEYYELTAEDGETPEYTSEDAIRHIYGLRINDEKLFTALGYTSEWTVEDKTLIIGFASNTKRLSAAENFFESLIKDESKLVLAYEESSAASKTAGAA